MKLLLVEKRSECRRAVRGVDPGDFSHVPGRIGARKRVYLNGCSVASGSAGFPSERVTGLVENPSPTLRAVDLPVHECLDHLFPAEGAWFAFAQDEGHLVGLIGGFEYADVLSRPPPPFGLAAAEEAQRAKDGDEDFHCLG